MVGSYGDDSTLSLPVSNTYQNRVTAIYLKYEPVKVADVPMILEKFKGREESLITKLLTRFEGRHEERTMGLLSPRKTQVSKQDLTSRPTETRPLLLELIPGLLSRDSNSRPTEKQAEGNKTGNKTGPDSAPPSFLNAWGK